MYRKGIFADVDGLPVISLKLWRNRGESNTPSSEEAQFRTLISAKDVAFPAAFISSRHRNYFYQNPDQPLASIIYRTGVDLEKNGPPMIFLKFRRNRGQSVSF